MRYNVGPVMTSRETSWLDVTAMVGGGGGGGGGADIVITGGATGIIVTARVMGTIITRSPGIVATSRTIISPGAIGTPRTITSSSFSSSCWNPKRLRRDASMSEEE